MKKLIAFVTLAPLFACAATSTPVGFTDNLDAAFKTAKATGKYVYACFSGSDWCGWCKKLDEEVFSHKEFLDGVTNDFELVYIDLPQNKEVLSEHAKAANEGLVKKYGISGFPTALIFSADGERLTQTGYQAGGPTAYADYLKGVRKDGPGFAKKEAAKKAYIKPFVTRQEAIEKAFEDEMRAAQKAAIAAATVKMEALVKDVEASAAPEGLADAREEFLSDLRDLLKMLKGEK